MNDQVYIHVQVKPEIYLPDDSIYVFIPPKLWGNEKLAQGVKSAIEMTFNRVSSTSEDPSS